MTPEQKAAYINAQTAAMLAEMEGMKSLNRERIQMGMSIAYDEVAFLSLTETYGLAPNTIIEFFRS